MAVFSVAEDASQKSGWTALGLSKRLPLVWIPLIVFLLAQIGFSNAVRPLRPAIEEMPFPLSDLGLKAVALGDDQFLFRYLARWLQDVGDGGGRVRPLVDYDYDRVVGWLRALDHLDDRSDYSYLLAARYFGAVMDPIGGPPRIRKIVEYFHELGFADPGRHWPWLVWAATKAHRVVKDKALCGTIADDLVALRANPDVPSWLPLLASPLYRFAGNVKAADMLDQDPKLMDIRHRDRLDLDKMQGISEVP